MKNNQSHQPSIFLSLGSAILLILAFGSSTAHAKALRCKQSDALLRVKYHLDKRGWDSLVPQGISSASALPSVFVRPSGNVGKSRFIGATHYTSYDKLLDYEVCVPKEDSCLEVVVTVLPASAYEISFDGKVVKVDRKYPAVKSDDPHEEDVIAASTTELGTMCTPVCNERTHALFEYEYWSNGIGGNFNAGMDDYRVVHQDGTTLFGCGAYGCRASYLSLYKHKECLPRDVCYEFNIGSSKRKTIFQHDTVGKTSYVVKYDGNIVDKKNNWVFESVKFGYHCQPSCNPVTQSTVELFLHQAASSGSDCDPREGCGLQWQLAHNENHTKNVASKALGFASKDTDNILVHETMCVPKNHCAVFRMVSTNTDKFTLFAPRYMLTYDSRIHKNTKWWARDHEELDDVTSMGPCASVADMLRVAAE